MYLYNIAMALTPKEKADRAAARVLKRASKKAISKYLKPKPAKKKRTARIITFTRKDGTPVEFVTRCNPKKSKICEAALLQKNIRDTPELRKQRLDLRNELAKQRRKALKAKKDLLEAEKAQIKLEADAGIAEEDLDAAGILADLK